MSNKQAARVISVNVNSDATQLLDDCIAQPDTRTAIVLNIMGDSPALVPQAMEWIEQFQTAAQHRQVPAPWLIIWHDALIPEQHRQLQDRLMGSNATLVDCEQPPSGFLNLSTVEGIKRTLRTHGRFRGGVAEI